MNNNRSSNQQQATSPALEDMLPDQELPPMQDKPSDLTSELMMTINIEPTNVDQEDEQTNQRKQSNETVVEAPVKDQASTSPISVDQIKEKIPRPPNSFMIFANEWRRQLAGQFPNESNKEISVRLGVMWKNLTEEVKVRFHFLTLS